MKQKLKLVVIINLTCQKKILHSCSAKDIWTFAENKNVVTSLMVLDSR